MKKGKGSSSRDWHTASELPEAVFEAMRKPEHAMSPIAVVATVNADGSPHTAPFASLRAVTPKMLRMICFRYHHTFTNLVRDERLMVSFLAPPDIAVSIKGHALLTVPHMEADKNYAIFEIQVDEVKNDMVKTVVIDSPLTASPRYEYEEWFDTALRELER
jgi:hypothetical protein